MPKKFAFFFSALVCSVPLFAQKAPLGEYRILKIKNSDSVILVETWNRIVKSIRKKEYAQLKELSLEKIYCESLGHIWPGFKEEQSESIDSFINIALIKYYDQHFIDVISDSTYHINVTMYQNRKFPNFKLKSGKSLTLYDIYYIDYVQVGNKIKDENYYVFRFVKINDSYKFFGLNLEWPSAIKHRPL